MVNRILLLATTTVMVSETSQEAPMLSLSIFMAFLAGYAIRLGIDIQKNQLTWKKTLYQILFAFGLSWAGLNLWPYLNLSIPVTSYIFGVTIFGVFIVSFGVKITEEGIRNYFRSFFKKIMADEEIKEHTND